MDSNYINDEITRVEEAIVRKERLIATLKREIEICNIQKSALIDALEKTA